MDISHDLQQAVAVYFDAKSRMFMDVPEFRVFHAGPLRGFHRHPNWPEQDAFYVLGVEPSDVMATVKSYHPHPHHMITVFADAAEPFQKVFTHLGYRPMSELAQPFMQLRLDGLLLSENNDVQKVRTPADWTFINSSGEVMKPSHLDGSAFRYYFIERDGKPICTGRYMMTALGAIYIAGLDTAPEYRRLGLATALLDQMHRDALAEGATLSVLCSSPMGFGLYHSIGYEVLTYMHAFIPQEWTT